MASAAGFGAPQLSAQRRAQQTGLTVSGEGHKRENRLAGLGPLLGLATEAGLGALTGAVLAVTRGAVPPALLSAMLGGARWPAVMYRWRSWELLAVLADAGDWATDIVPHLAPVGLPWPPCLRCRRQVKTDPRAATES